jgi:F0F1-type ATP synthase assembly protein I
LGKDIGRAIVGYDLAFKFAMMLVCPIFGSFFAGIFIDRKLGTTPWLMFLLVTVGMAFSIYAVYRVAARMQTQHRDEETK